MPLEPARAGEAATAAPVADPEHSRFVQRVRRRLAQERAWLSPGVPGPAAMAALISALQARGRSLPAALRITRHLVIERLATLDVGGRATLDEVTAAMTDLAEAALELALAAALAEADERHGAPLDAQGQRVDFWIVGMGKLGARELNVSSDIDLVYVYEDEGQGRHTEGPRPVSFHEYFSFVAKRLYALVGDVTDEGFVFRVDLALRPNGNSGPPVVSLAMLEEYFQVQGREWERFAWLKSRVVAPRAAVASGRALALRSLVTPFVYRRYLDYGVFEGLRQLHHKIRDEAQRRAAGRPERANDVKVSRGGIREIEFIVQLLLVVRGGQFPEIRTRRTLRGLDRVVARGLMKPETARRLGEAYVFLRQIEHRIQYLDDQQTHLLPTVDADLAWIARSLGLACRENRPDEGCELLDRLGEVRERVAAEFDSLLREGQSVPAANGNGANGAPCKGCGSAPLAIDGEGLAEALARIGEGTLAARVAGFAQNPRVRNLRDESRLRLGRLAQRAGEAVQQGWCSEIAAVRFVDWLEPLLRRESYIALLAERPSVLKRLLRLLGLARWPMQYLMRHPGVIDELADERQLQDRFDRAAFEAELEDRRAAWQRSGEDDEDKLLDTLRHAHHAEVFRTLVRDVEGRLTVEQVADDLSALADAVLATVLRWAWPRFPKRHRETSAMAVIAYGKLGGKELGYGSDLDVVFLYDDGDEPADDEARQRAQEVYGAFVRKVITWLTLRTAAGELFDIDTALRPNGSSGLLVTTVEAYERYQVGRGSNTAWTWEHQALTRARFAAGPPALAARFEATRRAVLTAPRDAAKLRDEITAMRERVRAANPVRSERFELKHSTGGMMDVEFAVQMLVLAHGGAHPQLLDNAGNIALLQRAEAAGLVPAGVGMAAADAYRTLRRLQHRARLDEQPTHVEPAVVAREREAVLALWRAVFG
jgi:glutamate-ammonia-ligase adenylyltransferase